MRVFCRELSIHPFLDVGYELCTNACHHFFHGFCNVEIVLNSLEKKMRMLLVLLNISDAIGVDNDVFRGYDSAIVQGGLTDGQRDKFAHFLFFNGDTDVSATKSAPLDGAKIRIKYRMSSCR